MAPTRKIAFDLHELLDELEDNTRTEDWENEDFSPEGLEIAPPPGVFGATSGIKIVSKPSIDILNEDLGPLLAAKYGKYMLSGGEKSVRLRVESQRHGLLACEYTYPSGDEEVQDFWDYQGPLKATLKITFLDEPLKETGEELSEALQAGFLSRGYDETDPKQKAYAPKIESLRFGYKTEVEEVRANPIFVPVKEAATLTLSSDEFSKSLLEMRPDIFLHW